MSECALPSASGIYLIINTINGHRYIGSATSIRARHRTHLYELRHNKHPNRHLNAAFRKYGEEAFTFSVLEVVSDLSQLLPREQHYLDTLAPEYNIKAKATNRVGARHSPETRKQLSAIRLANPGKGMIGKRHSEESRRKMSEASKGRLLTDKQRAGLALGTIANRGRKRTSEQRQSMAPKDKEKHRASLRAAWARRKSVQTPTGWQLPDDVRAHLSARQKASPKVMENARRLGEVQGRKPRSAASCAKQSETIRRRQEARRLTLRSGASSYTQPRLFPD